MATTLRDSIDRIDPFAVAAVVVPLYMYLATLAPSVTFFDSGEFLTAIASLGTAHSPGYPAFINYAKPFTYLPFGNIAFRVNIATALSAALACYSVYLLLLHMLKTERLSDGREIPVYLVKGASLAASLSFAFSARLWLQSNHDKPYPLTSFLAAIIFYLLLLWRDHYRAGDERPHYIYIGALLWGLGFSAHQTMVLLLPSYLLLIVSIDFRIMGRIKEIIIAVMFAILGLSIQLHMPIRALSNPLLNWGDPQTLKQFLWNFLRKGYPVEPPHRDLGLLLKQIAAFNIPREFTLVGLGLLIIGLVFFYRKRRDEILAFAVGVVTYLLVIAGYFNTQAEMIFLTEEFFTPLYLFSAVFIGLGLFVLITRAVDKMPDVRLSSLPVKGVAAALFLSLPSTLFALNYYENDQHQNYVAYDYAGNTFKSLPQGAVLYTWGDSGAFPLWYLQGVERMREDLSLVHTPHLVFEWYLNSFPDLFRNSLLRSLPPEVQEADAILKLAIAEQLGRRPVYVDFSTRYSINFQDMSLRQHGICYEVGKDNPGMPKLPELSVWDLYSIRGVNDLTFRDLDTGKALLIYANGHMEAGELLLRYGRRDEGVLQLQKSVSIAPEMAAQVSQLLSAFGINRQ